MRRLGIVAGFALLGFAITLFGYIAARLGEEEIALLAGTLCGAGVAIPLGIIVGAALMGRRSRSAGPPPGVIVMAPPPTMPPGVMAQPVSPPPPIGTATPPVNIIGQSDLGDE